MYIFISTHFYYVNCLPDDLIIGLEKQYTYIMKTHIIINAYLTDNNKISHEHLVLSVWATSYLTEHKQFYLIKIK